MPHSLVEQIQLGVEFSTKILDYLLQTITQYSKYCQNPEAYKTVLTTLTKQGHTLNQLLQQPTQPTSRNSHLFTYTQQEEYQLLEEHFIHNGAQQQLNILRQNNDQASHLIQEAIQLLRRFDPYDKFSAHNCALIHFQSHFSKSRTNVCKTNKKKLTRIRSGTKKLKSQCDDPPPEFDAKTMVLLKAYSILHHIDSDTRDPLLLLIYLAHLEKLDFSYCRNFAKLCCYQKGKNSKSDIFHILYQLTPKQPGTIESFPDSYKNLTDFLNNTDKMSKLDPFILVHILFHLYIYYLKHHRKEARKLYSLITALYKEHIPNYLDSKSLQHVKFCYDRVIFNHTFHAHPHHRNLFVHNLHKFLSLIQPIHTVPNIQGIYDRLQKQEITFDEFCQLKQAIQEAITTLSKDSNHIESVIKLRTLANNLFIDGNTLDTRSQRALLDRGSSIAVKQPPSNHLTLASTSLSPGPRTS